MKKKIGLEDVRQVIKIERNYLTEQVDDLKWKGEVNSNEYKELLNTLLQLEQTDDTIRISLKNGWIDEKKAIEQYKELIKKLFIEPLGI